MNKPFNFSFFLDQVDDANEQQDNNKTNNEPAKEMSSPAATVEF